MFSRWLFCSPDWYVMDRIKHRIVAESNERHVRRQLKHENILRNSSQQSLFPLFTCIPLLADSAVCNLTSYGNSCFGPDPYDRRSETLALRRKGGPQLCSPEGPRFVFLLSTDAPFCLRSPASVTLRHHEYRAEQLARPIEVSSKASPGGSQVSLLSRLP